MASVKQVETSRCCDQNARGSYLKSELDGTLSRAGRSERAAFSYEFRSSLYCVTNGGSYLNIVCEKTSESTREAISSSASIPISQSRSNELERAV
jgi:hypothetical protein